MLIIREMFAADILAKGSISSSSGTMFFLNPPAHLILSILDGIAGTTHATFMG